MLNEPSPRQEAMRYWQIMQASAEDLPFSDRVAELQMLARHAKSEVLRDLCEKNIDASSRRPVRQRLSEIRA